MVLGLAEDELQSEVVPGLVDGAVEESVGPHPPYFQHGVVVGGLVGAELELDPGYSEEELLSGEAEVNVVPELAQVVVGLGQPLVGVPGVSGDDDVVQVTPDEVLLVSGEEEEVL